MIKCADRIGIWSAGFLINLVYYIGPLRKTVFLLCIKTEGVTLQK